MGYWKQQQIQEWDQAFSNPPEKHVCAKHFENADLQKFVRNNSEAGACDYCGKKRQVTSLHKMVVFINEKIKDRYTDLEDANLPSGNSWLDKNEENDGYLKRVGAYVLPQGEEYWDADEFFRNILPVDDDDLFNDVAGCFSGKLFCRNEPLYPPYSEELSLAWKHFSIDVKESKKYSFHDLPDSPEPNFENGYQIDILEEIEGTVRAHNLIKDIPIGTVLYRCRNHNAGVSAENFSELASPPLKYATFPNRMSPAGVSMFYGAGDLRTAQLEAQSGDIDEADKMISWGVFESKTTLKLLDFTDLPKYKGIWSGDDYEVLNFLHSFAHKISEPLDKKEEMSKGYLPTQILTGYFKSLFPELDGLIYRSAKKEKGRCFVLFYDADECPKHLELVSHESHRMSDILPIK